MIMRLLLSLILVFSFVSAAQANSKTRLYRLNCGEVDVADLNVFSIDKHYTGKSKTLVSSCYLIQHGENFLIWDTGIDNTLIETPESPEHGFHKTVQLSLQDQLKELDLGASDITHVAVSHGHGDHAGNLPLFKNSELLIQKTEYDFMKNTPDKAKAAYLGVEFFKDFLHGEGKVNVVDGDYDVFGDKSVQLISLPGHTIGHMGLMVHLKNAGPVILSGDQWHFSENRINDGVPTFNFDVEKDGKEFKGGEQTRESSAKLETLIKNKDALLIIQHEPRHVRRLPAFPAYLD